ncbi:hypothetical protein [Streptomyces sp. Root369]|uniref:hypothetical protein n=1 Tax=Streptomyces sp. Root369 TaxID=1736523 RepID=UPI0007103E39|nr:hypothetical protein [Streptomyces sp. Root369]KQW03351.1 hypothetical protein ASD08_44455 [Streptomyces sp. Root369]
MKLFLQTTSEEDKELPGAPERPGNIGFKCLACLIGVPALSNSLSGASRLLAEAAGLPGQISFVTRPCSSYWVTVVMARPPGILDRLGRQAACPVVDGPRLTGLGMDGGVDAELYPGGAGDLVLDRDSAVRRAPGVIGVDTPGAGDHGCAGGDERGAA